MNMSENWPRMAAWMGKVSSALDLTLALGWWWLHRSSDKQGRRQQQLQSTLEADDELLSPINFELDSSRVMASWSCSSVAYRSPSLSIHANFIHQIRTNHMTSLSSQDCSNNRLLSSLLLIRYRDSSSSINTQLFASLLLCGQLQPQFLSKSRLSAELNWIEITALIMMAESSTQYRVWYPASPRKSRNSNFFTALANRISNSSAFKVKKKQILLIILISSLSSWLSQIEWNFVNICFTSSSTIITKGIFW